MKRTTTHTEKMHTCNIVGVLVPVNTWFISVGKKRTDNGQMSQPGPVQVLGLLQVLLHPDDPTGVLLLLLKRSDLNYPEQCPRPAHK